jgi:hypothetical protein
MKMIFVFGFKVESFTLQKFLPDLVVQLGILLNVHTGDRVRCRACQASPVHVILHSSSRRVQLASHEIGT